MFVKYLQLTKASGGLSGDKATDIGSGTAITFTDQGVELQKAFSLVVADFNNRPHISLNGLTPNEAEQNISLNKQQLHFYKKKACQERLLYNQTHQCNHCKE